MFISLKYCIETVAIKIEHFKMHRRGCSLIVKGSNTTRYMTCLRYHESLWTAENFGEVRTALNWTLNDVYFPEMLYHKKSRKHNLMQPLDLNTPR